MSVVETKRIDGKGISNDGMVYGMMISDHLDWEDEFEHLLLLEKKLNYYLSHIEKKQFFARYHKVSYYLYAIHVCFMYKPTLKCYQYINRINNLLKDGHIFIYIEYSGDESLQKIRE